MIITWPLIFVEHLMQREVPVYMHKSLNFEGVDIGNYCKEKDLEACAIKLNLNSTHICIISIYRTPIGNFNFFTNNLDLI